MNPILHKSYNFLTIGNWQLGSNHKNVFSEIHVHCTGQPGHGSLLLPNTAGEKVKLSYANYILLFSFHLRSKNNQTDTTKFWTYIVNDSKV